MIYILSIDVQYIVFIYINRYLHVYNKHVSINMFIYLPSSGVNPFRGVGGGGQKIEKFHENCVCLVVFLY